MKLAIDLKNCWLYGKGIAGFTMNLLGDIAQEDSTGIDIQLLSPGFDTPMLSPLSKIPKFHLKSTQLINKESRFQKIVYDQVWLLNHLKKIKSDILFSPYFDLPFFYKGKSVTTIHDLAVMDLKNQYGRAFSTYYSTLLKKCIHQSSYILTVSDDSKMKLLQRFNIPEGKVKVFYNKVNPAFHRNENHVLLPDLPGDFILYTGGIERRKNISLLIEGFLYAKAKCKSIPNLVITGVRPEHLAGEWSKYLNAEGVIRLSYLSTDQMVALYRKATILVNTSGYEGFGLPVLETLTVGKTLICSDIGAYREIGEDHVHYFKNGDQQQFTSLLIDFFQGKLDEPDTFKMKSRARFFNDQSYGRQFINLIQSVNYG